MRTGPSSPTDDRYLSQEGRHQGELAALVEAIEAVCEVLGIPLTGARRDELRAADARALRRRLDGLRADRRWDG